MGSLTENKQFNLKEEKTNLISTFLQKRLDKRRIFLSAKDEYFPMKYVILFYNKCAYQVLAHTNRYVFESILLLARMKSLLPLTCTNV